MATIYHVIIDQVTGGSMSASTYNCEQGTSVLLTAINDPGYILTGCTVSPSSVVISNNRFTMPASDVFITPIFSKINYSITKTASPSGAGTVSVKKNGTEVSSANSGDSLVITQTAASGYTFKQWSTSPAVTIGSGGAATMPSSNLTVQAQYLKKSIPSLNKTTLTGGETAILTITADNNSYTHQYKLSFGTGMETDWINVSTAGSTTVNITAPLNWSQQIPNATTKSGGKITLRTYYSNFLVGDMEVTGLTYEVPAGVKPQIGTITTSIARTIDGVTYANIGDIYVQNHCGVRTQASASGQQGSTITSIELMINGYSGTKYNKTVSTSSIDFTSGLLSTVGTTYIKIRATDSRGRKAEQTVTIEVIGYSKPTGSLSVRRVDSNGDNDDMGIYAKYALTKSYTAIGNNSLSWTLSYSGGSASSFADSGDIFPNNRKSFEITQEYTFTLTLTDSLETTIIRTKLPSARFIIAADSTGNRLGFMKFPNKTIPSGKNRTFEISGDTQVYIGEDTIEDSVLPKFNIADGASKTFDVPNDYRGMILITSAASQGNGIVTVMRNSSGAGASALVGCSGLSFTNGADYVTISNTSGAYVFFAIVDISGGKMTQHS